MDMIATEIKSNTAILKPVVETMPADLLTPLGVFLALSADSKNCFLLESVEGGETLARYSFIGTDPEIIVTGNGERISIRDCDGEREKAQPMFDYLREHFHTIAATHEHDLPSFIGGAIGYLNFSCVEWFEPSLVTERLTGYSQAAFMFYRSIVAFDHAKQVVKIITLVDETAPDTSDAERQNAAIRERLENFSFRRTLTISPISPPAVSSNFERKDFEDAVSAGKEYIFAGDCYQVVLSQRFSRKTNASDVSIYRA